MFFRFNIAAKPPDKASGRENKLVYFVKFEIAVSPRPLLETRQFTEY